MARRPNAYQQLIQEGKQEHKQEAIPVEDSTALKRQNEETPRSSNAVENRNAAKLQKAAKITIYPSQEQVTKLYDFMEAYRKRTGIRINQQDMIRRIIDVADINTLMP